MIAVLCAVLSGALFYASVGLGVVWPLAWLAPVPVLWLAFGETPARTVAFAAFGAFLIANLNLLPAYLGVLPTLPFAIGIVLSAIIFASAVLAAGFVQRRVSSVAAMLAFAALWTAWEYVSSFGVNGAVASIAYSQVGVPLLAQSASLFGLWSVTFLLTFFPAGVALCLRTRKTAPLALALALFALNVAYGAWRIEDSPTSIRVALLDAEERNDAAFAKNKKDVLAAIDEYTSMIGAMAERKPQLIVLPEKLTVLRPAWRKLVEGKLSDTAKLAGASIVVGFDEQMPGARRNVALLFRPDGSPPVTYVKRRLVPGLERSFEPGTAPLTLPDGIGLEICKDMDFPTLLRANSTSHPRVLAVPAWDFEDDAYGHARVAIMRGIENGVSIARAARMGLLTLSDPYGRIVGRRSAMGDATMTLVGNLPLGKGAGRTLYSRIGDVFAWACIALGAGLLVVAAIRPRTQI